MVAWSDLEYWRSSYLDESANAGGDGRRRTRTQVEELAGHFDRFRSEGQAADAMRGAGTTLQDDLDHLVQVASEYMLASEEAADGVRRVEAKARSAQEISAEIGYPIKEDGSLDPFVPEYEDNKPVPGLQVPPMNSQTFASVVKQSKYGELQQCIADALRIAEEVDAALEKRLSALANGTFDGGGAREGRDSKSPGLPDDADPSWSPAEVSAWWHALSDAERQECIERDPATYGNLDGIDMASRDKANRLVLHGYTDSGGNHVPGLIEKAEAAVAAAQDKIDNAGYQSPRESDLGAALRLDLENAQHDLEELRRLDAQLQRTGTDGAPTSLLVLDPSGERLKAAVAVGDVDNAKNVATFVPGMGTNVHDSIERYMTTANTLRDTTAVVSGTEQSDTAVVAWLGYDAPQNDVSVASTEKAEAGAPRLNNFLTGIKSWRWEGGGDLHQTVVSHSYGSTTAGLAMKDIGAGVVDDFIYTGSPGAGTSTVSSLGVDPSHVWVSATDYRDFVQGLPPDRWESFGRDPVDLEGIQHLSGDTTGSTQYKSFSLNPAANHSTYFDAPAPGQHNEALDDICRVIGGAK
mgnify:FL=1